MSSEDTGETLRAQIDRVYRVESRRVLATLIRLLGDFERAEEAMHEAFAAAMEQWPRDGVRESARLAGFRRPFQGDRRAPPPGEVRRVDRRAGLADGAGSQRSCRRL